MSIPIEFGAAEWVQPKSLYVGYQIIPLSKQHNDMSRMIPKSIYNGEQITPVAALHAQHLYDPAITYAGQKREYINGHCSREFQDRLWATMGFAYHHEQHPATPKDTTQQKFRRHLEEYGDADWQGICFQHMNMNINHGWHAGNYPQYHHAMDSFESTDTYTGSFAMDPTELYHQPHDFPLPIPPPQENIDNLYTYEGEGEDWSSTTSFTTDNPSEFSRSDALSSLSSLSSLSTPSSTHTHTHIFDPEVEEFQYSPPIAVSPPPLTHATQTTKKTHLNPDTDTNPNDSTTKEESFGFRYPIAGKHGSQTTEELSSSSSSLKPTITLRRSSSSPDLRSLHLLPSENLAPPRSHKWKEEAARLTLLINGMDMQDAARVLVEREAPEEVREVVVKPKQSKRGGRRKKRNGKGKGKGERGN